MKEILTQLFGDAVTDDAMKQFNAELGKKFVAKADFNAKVDEGAILAVVKAAIDANPAAVADYKSGKEKALQAIFGACMRQLKGAGDPAVIKATLEQKLK